MVVLDCSFSGTPSDSGDEDVSPKSPPASRFTEVEDETECEGSLDQQEPKPPRSSEQSQKGDRQSFGNPVPFSRQVKWYPLGANLTITSTAGEKQGDPQKSTAKAVGIGKAIPATLTETSSCGPNGPIDVATCTVSVPDIPADDDSDVPDDTVYQLNQPEVAWGELGQKSGWMAWDGELAMIKTKRMQGTVSGKSERYFSY